MDGAWGRKEVSQKEAQHGGVARPATNSRGKARQSTAAVGRELCGNTNLARACEREPLLPRSWPQELTGGPDLAW